MIDKNAPCAVEPLLPVELGSGKIKFAQGMKAGRWVFATGLMAQDFVNGVAPDVLSERAPHSGAPKREKEALRIFENLDAVLRAAGTDRANLVRTDQYYTTVEAVPPYQQVRREFLSGRIPPSTSIAQQRLLLPAADMNIQAMAIIPETGFEVQHLKHEQLQGRPTSGYSPALTVGDFIFVPGITSMAVGDEPQRNGVAAAALMAQGAQWGGQPIKLETEFIIKSRIVPSLALAGSRLEDVVHAQVYLTDREDYSAFNEVWSRHFGASGPTLSIIPCIEHGLAPYDGKIEINVLAVKSAGSSEEAPYRRGRGDRVPPSAAGGAGGRPAVHVSPHGRPTATGSCLRPPPTRASRASRRRRRRRRNSSSATSPSCAKPPARRSPMSCASSSSTPTSASFIRSTRCGSGRWAAGRCRFPRWRCRRPCPSRARPC